MIVDIFDEKHVRTAISSARKKARCMLHSKKIQVEIRTRHRKGAKSWKGYFDCGGNLYELEITFDINYQPVITTNVQTTHGMYTVQASLSEQFIHIYSPHFSKRSKERYRYGSKGERKVCFQVYQYTRNSENYDVYVDSNEDVMLIKNKGDLKVFITYLQAHMAKNIYKEIASNNCTFLDEHIEKYDLK